MSARLSVGFRFGLSRHDSVVSSAAGAIDVDRAAFEHDAGLDHFEAVAEPKFLRDDVVEIEGAVLFAPRVEAPVECDLIRAGGRCIRETIDENRAVVAHPCVIGRQMKDIDWEKRAGRFLFGAAGGVENHRAHFVDLFFIGDRQADVFEARHLRDHLGIDRRDDVELVGPGVAIMRPREVARDVRRPFGGHPIGREKPAMLMVEYCSPEAINYSFH